MVGRGRIIAVAVGAFVVGGVLALFTAGPALFADGAFRERLLPLGVSVASYAILGLLAGRVSPRSWKTSGLALAAPMVPVAWFFGLDQAGDPRFFGLASAFVLAAFAASLAGAMLGARLADRPRG